VNLSYFKVIGFSHLKAEKEIASLIAERLLGNTGGKIFSSLLFLCVLAYVNVILMSNPRVMFAMSESGAIPKIFSKKSKRREVLTVSLTVFTIVAVIILYFAQTFDKILSFVIFLDCIGMAASAAAIFKLRKETKHLDKKQIFSMKLFPLLPLIFICSYVFIAISIAVQNSNAALTAVGTLAFFIIIYFTGNALKKRA
jgi:APA family basic amino acid/polyamine antiporter